MTIHPIDTNEAPQMDTATQQQPDPAVQAIDAILEARGPALRPAAAGQIRALVVDAYKGGAPQLVRESLERRLDSAEFEHYYRDGARPTEVAEDPRATAERLGMGHLFAARGNRSFGQPPALPTFGQQRS